MPRSLSNRLLSAALLFLVSSGFLFPTPAQSGDEAPPHFWEGTISVHRVSHGPPSLTGVYDTQCDLRVRWKEAERLDVVDSKGKLVGQLVRLEDQGSVWQGRETGYWVHRYNDVVNESIYSGSGLGGGRTISVGWIYFSLSDEDPLAGVLPNGAYYFGSGSGTTAAFDTHVIRVVTTPERVDKVDISFPKLAMLDYFVGQLFMGFGRSVPGPVRVEHLRSMVPGPRMEGHDNRMRVIQDDRMEGEYDQTIHETPDLGLAKSLQWIVSWNVKRTLGVKAVLEKVPESWRPTLDSGEQDLTITARIREPEGVEGKFEFTLFEVSEEKGEAMNHGTDQTPDLEFPPGQAGYDGPREEGDSWVMEATETVSQAQVKVRSLDHGAWAKLKARVNVDGDWHDCLTEDGESYITIPLDEDENHIADAWEDSHGVDGQEATEDLDDKPEGVGDPDEPGDGFSNYEEYRGFYVQGRWTETDPLKKDLFIRDRLGFGVGFFTDLGLELHLIAEDEMDAQRTINFNRDQDKTLPEQSGYGQRGLILTEGGSDAVYGQTSTVGSPNVVDEVAVNLDVLWNDYVMTKRLTDPGFYHWQTHQETPGTAGDMPGEFQAELNRLIAHELGHGVNIMHHATSDPCPGEVPDYKSLSFEEMDYVWVNGSTAVSGGRWSGDLSCVMIPASPPWNYYGSDGRYHIYPDELVPAQTGFCSSKEGTSVNAAGFQAPAGDDRPYPVAGPATYGNCKAMVDLKGKHYYGDVSDFQ